MSQENVEELRRLLGEGILDRARVHRWYDEAWHPDVDWRAMEDAPDDVGVTQGRDALRDHVDDWVQMFDDLRLDPEEFIDADDQVIAVLRLSGRAKQSGVETDLRWVVAYTPKAGRIVSGREYATRQEALEASGLRE